MPIYKKNAAISAIILFSSVILFELLLIMYRFNSITSFHRIILSYKLKVAHNKRQKYSDALFIPRFEVLDLFKQPFRMTVKANSSVIDVANCRWFLCSNEVSFFCSMFSYIDAGNRLSNGLNLQSLLFCTFTYLLVKLI